MLPSPLGLLEYDVLEDAVFLGAGRKGGLRAHPTPFQGASVALRRAQDGYVARPLPGEAPPEINGEVVAERALADGDRIRIGDQVALFRTNRGPVQAPAAPAPAAEAAPRTGRPERRMSSTPRKNPLITVITLTGLALVLAAAYRAVNHLKAIQNARISEADLPELAPYEPGVPDRATRDLAALDAEARRRPERFSELVQLYRAYEQQHGGTAEGETAGERVRELLRAWSETARADLDTKVGKLVEAHQFARALEEVRTFEARFGSTPAAAGLDTVTEAVRRAARTALDALIARAGPLITPQPREAHRMLIGVSHEFPADMAVEIVQLLERCVARMAAEPPRRPRDTPPREPAKRPEPVEPPRKGPEDVPEPAPPAEDASLEAQGRDAWKAARGDLLAGRYAEALQGYTMLLQQYGGTSLFRDNKSKIQAGRRAARAGALGPQALVGVPVEEKRGRLEMEYHFDDQRVFEEDWTVEQPFSSDMPVQAQWKRGEITIEKATGMLHRLVFLADVRIEASVRVIQPHDFGIIALQESDDFRAILFNVANTQFKLKKGDAAHVNPGHVLWYIGKGVWRDADADAHGFIKIAERPTSKLQSGDRLKLELERSKDKATGTFQGKTDGVSLEGKVKGDDGSTMGPGRVGLFTNSGIIVVESVQISGRVDLEWFRKELAFLVAADPGPSDD